ncbi:unnamed protein product [Owenia fusiformis]|uniref:Plant heme peroxidase family profile domain-containing protein n=2 Tax=Owenia fusiformis TaxID=6347 RepID=A0A8S4NI83_OWEFU|nr:unnamed protein product [Owenia fusiformis]
MITALATKCEALTETRVESIKALISAHITAKDVDNNPGTSLLAGVVRLAYTDCIGGCDGCVNVADEKNAGLEQYIDQLDEFYDPDYTQIMSRADLWALAAIVALEDAANNCNGPSCGTPEVPTITFRFGRVDCAESPKTTTSQTIPDAHNVETDEFTVLGNANDLNLSDDEIVALMGAHTLGKARKANVGFNGAWVQKKALLNNGYYVDMIDSSLGWTQSDLNAGNNRAARWQWDQGQRMMLNTDMNLYKELDLSANDGSSACTYSSCPDASTKAKVEAYAASNTLWISEFGPAFEKMIENTDETLKDLYTTLTTTE